MQERCAAWPSPSTALGPESELHRARRPPPPRAAGRDHPSLSTARAASIPTGITVAALWSPVIMRSSSRPEQSPVIAWHLRLSALPRGPGSLPAYAISSGLGEEAVRRALGQPSRHDISSLLYYGFARGRSLINRQPPSSPGRTTSRYRRMGGKNAMPIDDDPT